MKIEITYKLKNSEVIKSFLLTPEQYFDPIKEGENYEDDSIAIYGDTIEYINKYDSPYTEDDLEYAISIIQGSLKSDSILKTTYFGNESVLRYLTDSTSWELIIQSIRVASNCIVITRMERPNLNSEWTNISFSTGLNYKNEEFGKEIWYTAKKGEYINQIIPNETN